MKRLLLLICLLAAISVSAQDYRAYVPLRPACYFSDTTWTYYGPKSMKGIAEDTVWYNGSRRVTKSYQENVAEYMYTNIQCFQLDTSWVGLRIEQDTLTGETWFFNYEGDTIRFFAQASVGQTGMYCRFQNGNVMRAIVGSVISGNVMTTTDSIRIMTMALENAAGNPLPHAMNGKQIGVSKQYGLVQTYEWADFPNDTVDYTLAGMENPVIGQRIITAAQIYDYNVGDRFDWSVKLQNWSPGPGPLVQYYYSWTITSKVVNGDTVTYGVTQDYVYKINTQVMQQTWGQTFNTAYYLTSEDAGWLFPESPFDIMNYPDTTGMNGGSFTFATMPYAPGRVNGRQLKGHNYGAPYYYDTTGHCFNGLTVSFGPCDGWHAVFGEGIGKVYQYSGSATCWTIYQLEYFEKGSETWGTPHNWSVILDVPAQNVNREVTTVYPNPADEVIFVNIPENGSLVNYQIYNNCGQLVESGTSVVSEGKAQIPVNQLASGAYSLVFENNGQQYRSLFVK